MAFIKATKRRRRHRASTCFYRHQSDMPTPNSGVYFIVKSLKKSLSCPNNNRGVTHQTDEKHLHNMSEYFVGVVNIAFNRYNNRFALRIINHNLLKCYKIRHRKTCKMSRLRVFHPPRLAPYHMYAQHKLIMAKFRITQYHITDHYSTWWKTDE